MLTRQEAEAIYDAGKQTVVRVLLELARKVDQLTADFAALKAENAALRAECQTLRATGSLRWLHTVSTRLLTWYYAHKRRGREAIDAAGILADYRGCAVHDCWKSYFDYDCDHALCNAHLLRELTFLWEEQSQPWAKAMIDHLLTIKEAVASASASGLTALPPADQERFLKGYERIVQAGYAQNPLAPAHGPKRRGRRQPSAPRGSPSPLNGETCPPQGRRGVGVRGGRSRQRAKD